MKRYVRANSAFPNRAKEWLHTDEFNNLTSGFTRRELRILGKITNSSDPTKFVEILADVIDTMEIPTSKSFDTFLNKLLELI